MKEEIVFHEYQQMKRLWVLLILAGMNIIFIVSLISLIGVDIILFILMVLLAVLFSAFISFFTLETIVDDKGVSVRFFVRYIPVRTKYKHFSWEEISVAYIRKYSPITEYGGWGTRKYGSSNGAYNMSGNIGLQLVFKNGKKLLIGTNNPDTLSIVLKKLGKLNE
jgi:hypothetical protein